MKPHQHTKTRHVVKRLARIEGHVGAIRTMVLEGRSCPEVLTQLAAVRGALEQVERSS